MKIASSFLKIQDDAYKISLLDESSDLIHFDIMDGIFTENASISLNDMKENTKFITKPKDIHLMVCDVKKYIDEVISMKPFNITFHYEAVSNPILIIDYLKSLNIKVGMAINPETDVDVLKPYLSMIDVVLVMSVHPGKGGQKFIDVSDKLLKLKNYQKDYDFLIEVDGGINDETIKFVSLADIAVSGSFITDGADYDLQIKKLRDGLL